MSNDVSIENLNQTINEEWFKQGAFGTYKKPSKEHYEIATSAGVIQTPRGEIEYKEGYYIVTSAKGEKHSFSPDSFFIFKEDIGHGTCQSRKIMKIAKPADHSGTIYTSRGEILHYTQDVDIVIRHIPNEYTVLKQEIFDTTYERL